MEMSLLPRVARHAGPRVRPLDGPGCRQDALTSRSTAVLLEFRRATSAGDSPTALAMREETGLLRGPGLTPTTRPDSVRRETLYDKAIRPRPGLRARAANRLAALA